MDRDADGQTWIPFLSIFDYVPETNFKRLEAGAVILASQTEMNTCYPGSSVLVYDRRSRSRRQTITCAEAKHVLRELRVAGDHAAMVRPGRALDRAAWVRADAVRAVFAALELDRESLNAATFWVTLPSPYVGETEGGWETLLHKAAFAGNAPIVSALIAAGCDLESEFIREDEDDLRSCIDKESSPASRETALGAAIRVRNLEVMRLLLAAGANPNHLDGPAPGYHGGTLLGGLLLWFTDVDALKLLLEAGADVEYAADRWRQHNGPTGDLSSILEFFDLVIPYGPEDAQNAAAAAMTRCLIKAGVRNSVDINGAFKTAILQGYRIILGPLLEAGADLEAGIEFSENPPSGPHDDILPRGSKKWARTHRYLKKVEEAGGYENLVATYRRVLTAPESALAKFIEFRFGRTAPHDVLAKVLEFWKPPGGP